MSLIVEGSHYLSVYVCVKASVSLGDMFGSQGEPLVVRKAPSVTHATVSPLPWHWYTCRPFFQRHPSPFSNIKVAFERAIRTEGEPFMWFVEHGRGPGGAWLKKMHLAGAWAEHTQIHTHQHLCYLIVYFTERLQYHRKNNTANVIVCLFAYFVQSVCQMQIESTRQLQHAPPLPRLSPHARHSAPGAARTHPTK